MLRFASPRIVVFSGGLGATLLHLSKLEYRRPF